MAKYQKYAEYKDSGIEWLGEIPSHWTATALKRYSRITDGSHHSPKIEIEGFPFVSVTDVGINNINFFDAKKITETDYLRLVKEGCKPAVNDVLLTKDGTIGRACIVTEDMPDFVILSSLGLITPNKEISSHFLYYYLVSGINVDQMNSVIHGSALKRMTINKINDLILTFPDFYEQEKIASFLDHETAKIDSLIAKQEKLIELLKEKRQAVISHAVTKGLNPDVAMKDSGVEWLGQVPEHWQKKILKYIVSQQGGGTPDKSNLSFWDGDIPWVSPKDMKVDYISTSQDKITVKAIEQSSTKLVPIGSVLMVVRGMILIHSVPVALTQEAVTINQDMKALIPNNDLDSEYFLYLLKGLKDYLLDYVETSGHGTKCLRSDDFMNMPLFLPNVEEQKNIVQYIKNKSEVFDSLINKAESAIQLMQERRTALISSAVTGKIDVRHHASRPSGNDKKQTEGI